MLIEAWHPASLSPFFDNRLSVILALSSFFSHFSISLLLSFPLNLSHIFASHFFFQGCRLLFVFLLLPFNFVWRTTGAKCSQFNYDDWLFLVSREQGNPLKHCRYFRRSMESLLPVYRSAACCGQPPTFAGRRPKSTSTKVIESAFMAQSHNE